MPAVGPDWKLDRRDSGRLFWRRDSSSNVNPGETVTPSKERVKFRYDVEVLEFWEAEDQVDDPDVGDVAVVGGELRPMRARTGDSSPSFAVCVACLAAIVASIWYQWLGTKIGT